MSALKTLLKDEHIVEALTAFKDADSVELKLTVSDSDRYSAIAALDMDPLEAEFRQVVFFDTPSLKLSDSGVVLRARRTRKGGDTVVKLRPVTPADLPNKLRRSNSFTIEVDVIPGSLVCSGSLKGKVDNAEVHDVLSGKRNIRKLFLPEQRSLYKEHAPRELDWDSLIAIGPINVAKLKFPAQMSKQRMAVAELWFYPDSSRILELSIKCPPDEAFQVLVESRAFLKSRGISLTGDQETKTRKALEYFSRYYRDKPRKTA
jgi:hypothetical protein